MDSKNIRFAMKNVSRMFHEQIKNWREILLKKYIGPRKIACTLKIVQIRSEKKKLTIKNEYLQKKTFVNYKSSKG